MTGLTYVYNDKGLDFIAYPHSMIHFIWQSDKRKVRESLYHRDKISVDNEYKIFCSLCGDEMNSSDMTIDHIKPLSKGGGNFIANLQLTHGICNVKKGKSCLKTTPKSFKKIFLKKGQCE